jgi:ABC-type uncharacterized transport system permease subunit
VNDKFQLFGATIRYANLGIWVTVLVTLVLVNLLLKRTKVGLAFRSVSSNLESSRLVGIHTGRTLQFGWALAAAVGTALLSVAHNVHMLSVSFAIASLGYGILRPAFTSGASLAVEASEQGELAGSVPSMNGAVYVISPAVGILLYQMDLRLPYLLSAAVLVLAAVYAARKRPRDG